MKKTVITVSAIVVLLLVFFYVLSSVKQKQISCLFYPVFLEEALRDFAKEYKKNTGYEINFVTPNVTNRSFSFNEAIPKMIKLLDKKPDKYDIIMIVSNETLFVEEQNYIQSFLELSENGIEIYSLGNQLGLGINKLSLNKEQSKNLINSLLEENKLGLLTLPAWERRKIKQDL